MSTQGKPQRPVHCMPDADPRRNHHLRFRRSVVPHLQRRCRAGHIQPVVQQPRQPERQAQPARSRSDHPHGRILIQTSVPRHLRDTHHRLQGPKQNACPESLGLAADVRAKIPPVDRIQIRIPWWPEQHQVPRRRPAMGVRCRIWRIVMRPQVGLDLHNPPGQHFSVRAPRHQQLAQAALGRPFRANPQRIRAKSAAPEACFCLLRALFVRFFHSFTSASTSSAWPSGVTFGKI